MSNSSSNEPYKNSYNVLRNSFLTKKEAARNNATIKLSSNILTRGKRHPLVKSWMSRINKKEKPYNFLTRRNNLWRDKKHSNFFNDKINMSKYRNILGSGGFGMIVSSTTGNNVVKLFYKEDTCGEMGKEYEAFVTAYNALEDNPLPQLSIPEPKKLDNRTITFRNTTFQCGIEMKRVTPIPSMTDKRNGMVHVVLKESYKDSGSVNKEVGRRYGETISNQNPSRGFFATGSYIESDILPILTGGQKGDIRNINDIAYKMGYAFALLVTIAEMYPNDVEYCLGIIDGVLNVVIMDFGMCAPIDYSNTVEHITKYTLTGDPKAIHGTGVANDFYFPENDDPTFPSFIRGIDSLIAVLTDDKKKDVLNMIKSRMSE